MVDQPYWSSINWTAIAAFIGAVGVVSGPFFTGLWSNRTASTSSIAKVKESEVERLERRERLQYERTEARAEKAEKQAQTCEAECEVIRNQALGMQEWAHWMRHEFVALMQKFCNMTEMPPERVQIILQDMRQKVPAMPPNIPFLHDVDKMRPPP